MHRGSAVVRLSPVIEAVGVTSIPPMLVTSSASITGLKFLQGPCLLGLLIMPMFVLVSDDQVLNLMQLSQELMQQSLPHVPDKTMSCGHLRAAAELLIAAA